MSATLHTFPEGEEFPLHEMNLRVAERMVELLTGSRFTPVCFRLIHDRDHSLPAIKLNGTLQQFWPAFEARQVEGYGIFLVVNEGGHRASEIKRVRAFFVDADGIALPASWHAAPDFTVQRDELHWHAYWLAGGAPLEAFKPTQQRLAAYYGTDPAVCDLSRVMRLAGTIHQKERA